jgi:hypothetical protein
MSAVMEEMEESEFLSIIRNNAAISLIVTVVIVLAAYLIGEFVVPWLSGGSFSLSSSATVILTSVVMLYVFRKRVFKGNSVEILYNCGVQIFYACCFSIVMYIGGEVIVIMLMGLGILATLAILGCEFGLTGAFTWKDLREWVDHNERRKVNDRKRAEYEAMVKGCTESPEQSGESATDEGSAKDGDTRA